MRIKTLSIQNFRSIESLEFEVPQVCALVGANNAGKSNILEAMRRVLGTSWVTVNSFSEDDVFRRERDRVVSVACTVDPPVPYRKVKDATPTEISTLSFEYTRDKIGEFKGRRRLEQNCLDNRGKPAMAMSRAPRKGQPPEFSPLTSIPQEVRDQVPLIYIGTNRSLKEQLPNARYSLLRQMFESVSRQLDGSTKTVSVVDRDGNRKEMLIRERFSQLMDAAIGLLRTDEFVVIEKAIKKHVLEQLGFDLNTDPDKLNLFFTPLTPLEFYKTLDLVVAEDGFQVSAQEMGEGLQNAIVLGILQAFEETQRQGAILLIEEPEMFLHPQMQRSLYKTLRRIGETNQVIYTTHSPHFVTIPEYQDVVLVRRLNGSTLVQQSQLPMNPQRREKLVKEMDPERNELFFAKRLLIVEGDTEKLAFPEYAKRLNLDLDRAGATIVEVGGKRNLIEFANIAISFGIPTGVVYDKDSSDFAGKQNEESAYNEELDALEKTGAEVKVWCFDAKYEDHLRKTFGEAVYQQKCQKFPNIGKPTRARLIAMETDQPIPDPVEKILRWFANVSVSVTTPTEAK